MEKDLKLDIKKYSITNRGKMEIMKKQVKITDLILVFNAFLERG